MAQYSLEFEGSHLSLEEEVAVHIHTMMAGADSQGEGEWSDMVGVAWEDKWWGLKDKEPKMDKDRVIVDIHQRGHEEMDIHEGACDTSKGEGHWGEDHHCQTH